MTNTHVVPYVQMFLSTKQVVCWGDSVCNRFAFETALKYNVYHV